MTVPWTLGHGAHGRPLIWGHRGAEHQLPESGIIENTVPSFERARDRGADGVELDVRLCASGEVIVFHDEGLARLAGRDERIDALDLAAVRQARLAGGARIPTLEDVFAAVDLLVNVEIKAAPARQAGRIARAVIEVILRSGARDRVLVSTFDPVILAAVRVQAPHIPAAYLFHAEQGMPLRNAWPGRALRPYALHPEAKLVTPARVRTWRRRGFAINAWTANEPAEIQRLAELGVDGIVTDHPAAARAAIGL